MIYWGVVTRPVRALLDEDEERTLQISETVNAIVRRLVRRLVREYGGEAECGGSVDLLDLYTSLGRWVVSKLHDVTRPLDSEFPSRHISLTSPITEWRIRSEIPLCV